MRPKYARKHGKGSSLWAASITAGVDSEGKPKRRTFYGSTRQAVADKLNEVISQNRVGMFREPSKLLLSEWLATWLNDYMKHSLRATTFESYEVQVRKHINPAIGAVKLSQLSTAHLQKLYNDKLSGGRGDGRPGGFAAKPIRYIYGAIYGALEQAKKEGMILINPAEAAKLPKLEKPEI